MESSQGKRVGAHLEIVLSQEISNSKKEGLQQVLSIKGERGLLKRARELECWHTAITF